MDTVAKVHSLSPLLLYVYVVSGRPERARARVWFLG